MNDAQQTAHENPRAAAKAAKAYAKATRPWYKKKRFIIPIVLVAIIVIASVAGGGGSESGPKVTGGDGKEVAASKAKPVKVGETVELEGTRYTVESAKTADTVGSEFFEETAGGTYVIVELTIENTKDETKTFSSEAAKLIAGNDKTYSTDDDGTIAADEPLIFEDMQPDVAKSGVLVFDVPKDVAKGAKLELSDLYGRGEAYVDLGL